MMRIATVSESQKIDRQAQEYGLLSADLIMESAGCLAAREIRAFWHRHLKMRSSRSHPNSEWIAVVCGPGGNGADGLVVARHLSSAGLNVRVYLFDASSSNELFELNLKRLPIDVVRRTPDDISELEKASLIVDALLGLGSSRNVHGVMKRLIEEINQAPAPTLSLDLPSGLDADRGVCFGVSVIAATTLTFGLAKRGFFVSDGPRHVGRLKILPIGFPIELVREVAKTQTAFGERSARRLLPVRQSSSNKSSNGRIAIFAGRPGMVGAALLSGLGAMRSGAGYVTLITHLADKDQKARAQIANVAPEFLTLAADADDIWDRVKDDAVIVGPGFGVGEDTLKILHELKDRKIHSVVVDADALTTLADAKNKNQKLPILKSWILTPHAGELARLVGGTAKELEANRFVAVESAAKELGAIVLFKGFRTIISDGVRSCVVLSGNAALAKAGSGDVLSGIIGGFLAQKMDPFNAACLGAYVHGRLADEWLRSGRDVLSLLPSDIAQALPQLLRHLRTSRLSDGETCSSATPNGPLRNGPLRNRTAQ